MQIYELPIPLKNYQDLAIRKKRKPYHDLLLRLFEEMEMKHKRQGDFVYVPDIEEICERINYRLSPTTVRRLILAWVKTAGLNDEEFYVTTTSGGAKNYHIKVNERTLSLLKSLL
jgi:hypothetical protein